MSKAKFNKMAKLEKELQELIEKQEQAKKDTFLSIGEMVFKKWDLENNTDYDVLEEFIEDKAEEFKSMFEGNEEADKDLSETDQDENKKAELSNEEYSNL